MFQLIVKILPIDCLYRWLAVFLMATFREMNHNIIIIIHDHNIFIIIHGHNIIIIIHDHNIIIILHGHF